jgi:hypothetical protein
MASSLETKVLYNPNLPQVMNYFPAQEFETVKVTPRRNEAKPKIHVKEKVKPEIVPATRRNYSKFTISLISAAFILLAGEATIYFHSVQVQKTSNQVQGKIIEMKEQNYRLNVELAKAKELSKVEHIAETDLQMQPSLNSKINYLILPEQDTNKEFLITKVYPVEKKLSINIGY